MADGSGDNGGCTPADSSVPLLSDTSSGWSAARWFSRIADEYGFGKSGENPGYAAKGAQPAAYRDTSSNGMMAITMRQAKSCGFRSIYWAHDADLWNNTASLSRLVALS